MIVCLVLMWAALAPTSAPCQSPSASVAGGQIYLPVYHSVFIAQSKHDYNLTVTMIVRNLDADRPLTVMSIKSYDQHGKYMGELLKEAVVLAPMAARRWLLPKDKTEKKISECASLIVQWQAAEGARTPLVQALMVGTRSTLGLSYVTTGIPLK